MTTNPYFAARAHADDTPQLVFVAGEKRTTLSAAAFWQAVEAEAARLAALGAAPGAVVLIFALNSPEALVAFFAAQRIGAIPSLMPPPSPRQPLDTYLSTHRRLVERIRPGLILADAPRTATLSAAFARAVEPLAGPSGAPPTALDVPLPPAGATALLQHSSGTTGLKKGVELDYALLARHLETLETAAGLGPQTAVVSWLPLYHDMGLIACTLLPVVRRHKLVLMDTFAWLADPLRILRLAAEEPSAVLWLPNFAYSHLANHARRQRTPLDLSRVEGIINCSEPCKPASMERFLAAFAPHGLPTEAIQCCYGMAENVFAVTQTPVGRPPRTIFLDRRRLEAGRVAVRGVGEIGAAAAAPEGTVAFASCGTPVAGTELTIRRADGTAAAADEVGRVFLAGTSLFRGYHGQPALTAERFAGEWFDTNDLGFLHEGELYLTGRVDDLIIVNGKNLLAHDIEDTVNGIAGVKAGRCSAFGCEDERTGSQNLVIAAEVPDEGEGARVREAIYQAVFGAYGIAPADIVLTPVDTLLKTTSGKMSRGENRARYEAGTLDSWRESAA